MLGFDGSHHLQVPQVEEKAGHCGHVVDEIGHPVGVSTHLIGRHALGLQQHDLEGTNSAQPPAGVGGQVPDEFHIPVMVQDEGLLVGSRPLA